jgi:hypothetical protein
MAHALVASAGERHRLRTTTGSARWRTGTDSPCGEPVAPDLPLCSRLGSGAIVGRNHSTRGAAIQADRLTYDEAIALSDAELGERLFHYIDEVDDDQVYAGLSLLVDELTERHPPPHRADDR